MTKVTMKQWLDQAETVASVKLIIVYQSSSRFYFQKVSKHFCLDSNFKVDKTQLVN